MENMVGYTPPKTNRFNFSHRAIDALDAKQERPKGVLAPRWTRGILSQKVAVKVKVTKVDQTARGKQDLEGVCDFLKSQYFRILLRVIVVCVFLW